MNLHRNGTNLVTVVRKRKKVFATDEAFGCAELVNI
jgi:hypothetical protein